MSELLKSDIFIIFMVVLSLTVISVSVVCCLMRHLHTRKARQKMAEIEIVPSAGLGTNHKPRFTLRIITEQKHASELVEIITSQIHSAVGPSRSTDLDVSAVTAEVASTSQDELEMYSLSPCPTTTDAALPVGEQVTSLDLQTTHPTQHLVTAIVEPIRITDDVENDSSDSETLQFYPALS
ncbi:hypothetical protein AMELA_G00257500 [Ameiurus melas]|uniref:Uncharacterized protein n=1 Tax=Ameiurus melas TaxID=219545 RepID=A0A7J5ZU98_AMEME|nr:hypothetical protein AMELA_G00257500 [Ameiurus melas]